jgi:hypothetical protein
LINVDKLKAITSLALLDKYSGKNPYLKKLQRERKKGNVKFTDNQYDYIEKFHNVEPTLVNRVISITSFIGEELQKKENLSFVPERILVQFILGETDKTFHIYGKLKKNQKESGMYWIPKTQVLDDMYWEEPNIEVDFDKYAKMDKKGRVPYKHQEEGIKFLLSRDGCILADDMGLGKSIANDVPVLTPDGWVPHGSLKVGDYVIGSNGNPTKVTAVHPQPLKDYYNITFTDGTVVESCDEHLWPVQTTNHKKRGNGYVIKPLKDLMDDLTWGTRGNLKWYIPMVEPVEFKERTINIDPYIMGVLLGDGSISSSRIGFSTVDSKIAFEISQRLPEGYNINHLKGCDYNIISEGHRNDITGYLKTYKLFGATSDTKFIPEDYKYNTKEIRLEVLQGLLDTDGWCSKSDGTIQYYSVSEQLSNDVIELVQSFGGVARKTQKVGKYKLPDGQIKECKVCYVLTINLPEGIVPFKLKRKIGNMKVVRKYLPSRGIKSIEFSRRTLGQCISVEADDHLYVMDKYVVTHNTYQSIVAALETGAERILIVCPPSVKINWEREIQCFDNNTAIVNGNRWAQSKFTIINYDILKNFHATKDQIKDAKKDGEEMFLSTDLVDAKFDLVIIDEAHYLKNHKSKRGIIMKELCVDYGIEKVWLLTGTPVANRPMDFYNLLRLVKSPIVDNWVYFAKRYCEGRKFYRTLKNGKKASQPTWLTNGASNLDELHIKTKNILLRRLKENVLDMPEKNLHNVYHRLSPTQKVEYDNLWEEYLLERKRNKKKGSVDRSLVELILLRQYIANETVPITIEMAENAIEQGQKVIIFTSYQEEQELILEHFGKKAVAHNGKMSTAQKQKSVDRFQDVDSVKVFVGNIISAGVGITLTAATTVIFNSLDWVPGNIKQAIDRAYRIGQKNNVSVYFNIFEETVDERVWSTLFNKTDVIDTILGGKDGNMFESISVNEEELWDIIDEDV